MDMSQWAKAHLNLFAGFLFVMGTVFFHQSLNLVDLGCALFGVGVSVFIFIAVLELGKLVEDTEALIPHSTYAEIIASNPGEFALSALFLVALGCFEVGVIFSLTFLKLALAGFHLFIVGCAIFCFVFAIKLFQLLRAPHANVYVIVLLMLHLLGSIVFMSGACLFLQPGDPAFAADLFVSGSSLFLLAAFMQICLLPRVPNEATPLNKGGSLDAPLRSDLVPPALSDKQWDLASPEGRHVRQDMPLSQQQFAAPKQPAQQYDFAGYPASALDGQPRVGPSAPSASPLSPGSV